MDLDRDDPIFAQIRATNALRGEGLSTQRQACEDIISVLRSKILLSEDFRSALADCIEDGLEKHGGPVRMELHAPGRYFKSLNSMQAWKRRLEVGHFIETERAKGRDYEAIYGDLSDQTEGGDSDKVSYGKRARELYAEFLTFLDEQPDKLELARSLAGNRSITENEDARASAFAIFCEAKLGIEEY